MQQPSMFVPRVVWAALLMSQGLYVAILLGGFLGRPPEPPQPILLTALSAVAMVVAAVSVIMPRVLHAQAARGVAQAEPALREHGPDALRRRAFQLAFTPFILSIALSEAVAIFGLVLGAIGFSFTQCAPFFAAGMLLTLIRFPTEERFVRPLQDALGQRGS